MVSKSNDCDFNISILEEFKIQVNNRSSTILLNENTDSLNFIINDIRLNKIEQIRSKKLSNNLKTSFLKNFNNSAIKRFNGLTFNTIGNLVDYVVSDNLLSQTFLTEKAIIDKLAEIDTAVLSSFDIDYPRLNDRLNNGGQITASEVNQFITEYGLDSSSFSSYARNNSADTLNLFERFLSGMGIGAELMGSFCSLIDNIYGVVNGSENHTPRNLSRSQSQLTNIISSITPRLGELSSSINSIRSLVEEVQTSSTEMRVSMQEAFQLLSSAMDIALSFYNPSTNEAGKVEVEWDYEKIKEGIENAINGIEPDRTLFIDNSIDSLLGENNVYSFSVGDINKSGNVNIEDTTLLQSYIDENELSSEITLYLEKTLPSYMLDNIDAYVQFTKYFNETNGVGNVAGPIKSLSDASSIFGSPSNPTSGDFGYSNIQQILGSLNSMGNSIDTILPNLQTGAPINIDSLLTQIQSIRSIADLVSSDIFSNARETLETFRNTTADALSLAEDLSVTNPERTAEIQESRIQAVGENVTRVLNLSAGTTTEIVPQLNRRLTNLETLLRNAAATGIIDTIENQLSEVVGASAEQLRQVATSFTPETLNNGFNFNMNSTFARFTGIRANALLATSETSVEHTRNVVRNNIAQNARNFRELNRDDVEFIALRFCNMAREIERLYSNLTEPLTQMIQQSETVSSRLSGVGNPVTTAAINAGAIRLPSSSRPVFAQTASTVPATIGRSGTVVPPNTLPNTDNGPIPVLPTEYSDLPRYVDIEGGRSWNGLIRYNLGGRTITRLRASNLPDNMGWDGIFLHGGGVNTEGINMLRRFILLCIDWRNAGNSVPLTVNSAYRPGDRTNSGGLSYHGLGVALDVAMSSNRQQEFATLARSKGFRGIGFYPSFIHIDTGPERTW